MAGKSPCPPPDPVIAALLKQCRKDGGAGYVGRIIRAVGQDERITAIVLADQDWAYEAFKARSVDVARYLHAEKVQIQQKIQDPLVAVGIALGGFVTLRR